MSARGLMRAGTSTEAPKVDLLGAAGITAVEDHPIGQAEDLGYPDEISDMVGRAAYLANWTADECLLPSEDGERDEAAVFDRYYFAAHDAAPVVVDELPGGSSAEVAQQEAQRHVARKRAWCKARGVKYVVHVDPLLAAFS